MGLTTSLIGSGATATTVTSITVTEDGQIDKTKRNSFIAGTLTTTATVVVGNSLNDATMRSIHQKYAKAYVESLTDEQLELALQKMNLLEQENIEYNTVKRA